MDELPVNAGIGPIGICAEASSCRSNLRGVSDQTNVSLIEQMSMDKPDELDPDIPRDEMQNGSRIRNLLFWGLSSERRKRRAWMTTPFHTSAWRCVEVLMFIAPTITVRKTMS